MEQGCRGPPTGSDCRALAFAPGPCCRLHQEEAGSPKDSGQQMAGHPLSRPLAWKGQGMRALPSQAGFCLTSSGMFPSGALCHRVDTAPAAHGAASQDHSVRLIHFVLLWGRRQPEPLHSVTRGRQLEEPQPGEGRSSTVG